MTKRNIFEEKRENARPSPRRAQITYVNFCVVLIKFAQITTFMYIVIKGVHSWMRIITVSGLSSADVQGRAYVTYICDTVSAPW